MSLLLFDIDGTLLLSGGAGVRAMTRAFEQVFGIADAFESIDVAGRTDTFLVAEALKCFTIDDTPAAHQSFRDAYIPVLREEIKKPPAGRCGLMAGVPELLDALRQQDRFHSALLTGNFEHAAYTKLGHFGIGDFFQWGAFGEESSDRNQLARVAMQRAIERGVPPQARERPIVIGDTPHDITCARAVGARVLAVATGSYSVDQLREADIVLPDLSDTRRVLQVIE